MLTDILLLVLLALAIAAAVHYATKLRTLSLHESELTATAADLRQRNDRLQDRLAESQRNEARLAEQAKYLENEVRKAEEAAKASNELFSRIAKSAIADEITQVRKDNAAHLGEILQPLREQIEGFQKKVDDCYNAEARERFALKDEVNRLFEQSKSIGNEARELATALRGNTKAQGDWGEMILENLLEKSGLREGEEFVVQQTRDTEGNLLKDDNGNMLRPDVVVYYPGGKAAVIDSKVSLTAFTEWVNAADDNAREAAAKRHLASVRSHINELHVKRYNQYVSAEKLDFVMMFIPNESAYIAAMQLDAGLWQEAYDKHVLIVSPTHLMSVLRLVHQLWSHDRQTRNALDIAEKAAALYDKFVLFIESMNGIEKSLNAASKSWGEAMNRLRTGKGNVIRQIEGLKTLGVKAGKDLETELKKSPSYKEIDDFESCGDSAAGNAAADSAAIQSPEI